MLQRLKVARGIALPPMRSLHLGALAKSARNAGAAARVAPGFRKQLDCCMDLIHEVFNPEPQRLRVRGKWVVGAQGAIFAKGYYGNADGIN